MAAFNEDRAYPSPRDRIPILPSLISPLMTTRPRECDHHNGKGTPVTRINSGHRTNGLEKRVRTIEQTQKTLLKELANVQRLDSVPSTSPHTGQPVDATGDKWAQNPQILYELKQQLDSLQTRLDRMDMVHHRASHDSSVDHSRQVQGLMEAHEHLKQQFQQLRQDWTRQKESVSASLDFSIAESQGRVNTVAVNELRRDVSKFTKDQNELMENVAHLREVSKNLETAMMKMKQANESRSSDIWTALNDLQGQVRSINSHHKQQEIWLNQSEIHESLRSISKSQASFAKKSVLDKIETQSLQQHGKLVDTLCQEMAENEKLWNLQVEQLKEEMNTKFSHLESQILITTADKAHRDSTTKKIKNLEKIVDELKQQLHKSASTLTRSVALLDKDTQLQQKDFTKVLQAEIGIRKEEILQLQEDLGRTQERCNKFENALQYSFATLEDKSKQDRTQYGNIISAFQKEWEHEMQLLTGKLALLQEQVLEKKKVNEMVQMEQKVASVQEQVDQCMAQGVEQKRIVDRLLKYQSDPYHRQEVMNNLRDMDAKISDNATQLYRLGATLQDAQMKLVDQLQSESNKRFQETLEIKNELAWLQQTLLGQHQPSSYNPSKPNNQDVYYPSSNQVPQPAKEESGHVNKKGLVYSPTPEPRSLNSSPTAAHKLRKSRRGPRRTHHVSNIQILEPPETMGTFTSAPATPEELRKIIVLEALDDHNEHQRDTEYMYNNDSMYASQNYVNWEEGLERQEEVGLYLEEGEGLYVEEEQELHSEEGEGLYVDEGQKEEELHVAEGEGLHTKEIRQEEEAESENHQAAENGDGHGMEELDQHQKEDHEDSNESQSDSEEQSLKKIKNSFIKPADSDSYSNSSWLTEWGMYQTLRLLQIKNRLMRPVNRLREEKRANEISSKTTD